jgi:hypothetical protein
MHVTDQENTPAQKDKMGLWDIVRSVFAAGLGVQSSKNRERDFNQGNAKVFFFAGLIFTVIFIGGVYGVVQMVLASAGR